ncbi:PEP-CTERM sorting domain-containing protein [Anabaena subtropica]|uniref:PEP-CTERM sorting domain-containing protein n=1 Tax=Anabaena subtropica FACHB-260 TaxID=2692884 RepID=A0ABR8CKR2_9NOST|nr:PEP-CTERM sorting domain-containing protein [Anabaena subtropica]MBD2343569.1 PEP-CTERM sorting domain-containing protein [Anabaena subtropica FACHB-260]
MYQKVKEISRTLITTLVISVYFGGTSQARTITDISPPTGPGQVGLFCPQVQTPVATPSPNNDNSITPSPNQILNFPGLSCSPKNFQAIAPIDTQLFVSPSGGTTEYFITETVVNNTSSIWNGFKFQIGFGINDNFAPPELILVPFGFAIPDFDFNGLGSDVPPTSSRFAQVLQDGSYNLQWLGGTVAPGESVNFTFSIDVPDDLDGNNFYDAFTIRQTPITKGVPEPTSITSFLTLLSVVGSGFALKRKQGIE